MSARESQPWRRSWVIGLALLSLAIPAAAGFLRTEPLVPFADPVRMSYYRQTGVALAVALACAAGTFVSIRTVTPASFRWLSVGVATLGVLLSAFLLTALIGTCGVPVLWGVCQP
jgi:hypothetical protein